MKITLKLDYNTHSENKNWKLEYSTLESEDRIELFNIQLNEIGDSIDIDVPDNWDRFYITPIDDEFSYATFTSGSI
jgi:subtilisin-like proprotein convertase family protein